MSICVYALHWMTVLGEWDRDSEKAPSVDEGGHVTMGRQLPIKSVDRARSGGRRRGLRIVDSGRDQELARMTPSRWRRNGRLAESRGART